MDLLVHTLLFLALAVPIVIMSSFYSEGEDAPALKSMPRRYAVFIGSCALVAGILLAMERLFAWPS